MRTITYNRVMRETDYCPVGELMTDCELKNHIKTLRHRRDIPQTEKVKVNRDDIYFCFGVRFAE